MDVDREDYQDSSVKSLESVTKEIQLLQALRNSKAQSYVNFIVEARVMYRDLWIVSEYCSGGSVFTLMKPLQNGNIRSGLEEKFIVTIARELATAIKFIHDENVYHRDIKGMCISKSAYRE